MARESWSGGTSLPRHRHRHSYAAIVLGGGYDEFGDAGLLRALAGHVVVHTPFEAHRNDFRPAGAEVLNLELPDDAHVVSAFGRIDDPDTIVRLAERDPREACTLLRTMLRAETPAPSDWPDLLARDIAVNPDLRLSDWASRHGFALASVSRGFHRAFAVTPSAFRAQLRARHAWRRLTNCGLPLARIAAEAGFADQAHMTRAVRALTGRPPSHWRGSNGFKTAARPQR